MAERDPEATDARVQALYRTLLGRFGLADVDCPACARALLPEPLNFESYTYTTTQGARWTWDIGCARALVGHGASDRAPTRLEPNQLSAWLSNHSHVREAHLVHIPAERLDEPVLLAPVPDGGGQILVDGAHRATWRLRNGLDVFGFLLTSVESTLAISVVPLSTSQVVRRLRALGILPREPGCERSRS